MYIIYIQIYVCIYIYIYICKDLYIHKYIARANCAPPPSLGSTSGGARRTTICTSEFGPSDPHTLSLCLSLSVSLSLSLISLCVFTHPAVSPSLCLRTSNVGGRRTTKYTSKSGSSTPHTSNPQPSTLNHKPQTSIPHTPNPGPFT